MRRLIFILCAMIGVSQAQTIQYIGAPTTTVISRGNFRTDSIFYLPKRSKAPTDTAALRYQISDSTVYVWTGSQWVKAGGGVGSLTGSGVAGYMPEFTTTTNLDTTQFYHSAGRFAIGSTTTTNGVFNVYGGTSYFDTSFRVGSSTLFANEANDRIGIGTTSPSVNLHINRSQPLQWLETTESNKTILEFQSTNNDVRISSTYNTGGSGYKPILFYTGGQERMRFDADGNLIIGKNAAYTVYTRLHLARSGYSQMVVESTLDNIMGEVAVYNGSDPFSVGTLTNHYMNFKTNGTERVRIFANGRVFIGSTPSDAGYQLDINGSLRTSTTITTGAPAGGSAKPWELGEVATVSPTSPNRTIRVEIDGVVYYIHAKTTND